jgi:multidrug efflux system membrane fusion protein
MGRYDRHQVAAAVLWTLVAGLTLFQPGCGKKKNAAPPGVSVLAADAISMDVPVKVNAIGTVEASNTVAITSRVTGQLLQVGFKEGEDVAKGALLFQIDPAPYQAAFDKSRADLETDQAKKVNADADLVRYTQLVNEALVAQEQYSAIAAAAQAADATVKADSAALEEARLNLEYCAIRSPIAGRTGSILVKPGNMVNAGSASPLVTINQIVPIQVAFAIPEQRLPDVRRYASEGTLTVSALFPSDTTRAIEGNLTFVDNAVDTETGTIELKATFPNEDRALWAGEFVRIELTLTELKGAVVIPKSAVQTSQEGQYVYTIKPGDTVEMRPVTVGMSLDDRVVIEKGITLGEKVVTDGQMRLRPGSKVVVKTGLGPAGPATQQPTQQPAAGQASPAAEGSR